MLYPLVCKVNTRSDTVEDTDCIVSLLPRMKAIALSNGSLWKVSNVQYNCRRKSYELDETDNDAILYTICVFIANAALNGHESLFISYDCEYDDVRYGDEYPYGRCDGLLLRNCTPKLIRLQRFIKERLRLSRLRNLLPAFAMGSLLTDDVMVLIASML
jgi:hypothetical protein